MYFSWFQLHIRHCTTKISEKPDTSYFGPIIIQDVSTKIGRIFKALLVITRSSHPEVFLRKGVLKIHSKFTGENPCRSVISKKLHIYIYTYVCIYIYIYIHIFIYLLYIFRTTFLKNISEWRLLYSYKTNSQSM